MIEHSCKVLCCEEILKLTGPDVDPLGVYSRLIYLRMCPAITGCMKYASRFSRWVHLVRVMIFEVSVLELSQVRKLMYGICCTTSPFVHHHDKTYIYPTIWRRGYQILPTIYVEREPVGQRSCT
jgi:hypothetical protein